MKLKITSLLITALLSGCAALDFHNSAHYAGKFKQYGYGFTPENRETKHTNDNLFSSKIITMYAQQLADQIVDQVHIGAVPSIAISSFVELDDQLQYSTPLGNRLADDLLVALRKAGFNVTEVNLADQIEVTAGGNFIFSREAAVTNDSPYILAGVIHYTPNGVNINSRFISMNNASVVAVATVSIPNEIVEDAFPIVEGMSLAN